MLAVSATVSHFCSTARYHYVFLLDVFIFSITKAQVGSRPPRF